MGRKGDLTDFERSIVVVVAKKQAKNIQYPVLLVKIPLWWQMPQEKGQSASS